MSFRLKKEIRQLRAKSSRLNKAQGLKRKKASSRLEKELKQPRVESSRLETQGLKMKKKEKRALGSKRK